ncbi:Proteophosphoglycan 5 [Rhodotorula toruloides ATCC 204091]|uniref:Proteophosphoglycan 5 n=1 Tax=Rhodotorula toruloides TaxID=5286 RepID=A0A0K3CMW3_RHOTO|nr:Proteophosphoglycan 5 [Rhodotorula toruloides ATCC 204091]PRQ71576.1 Proteophosphoglycan 5 [Rhodotorula toruloides]
MTTHKLPLELVARIFRLAAPPRTLSHLPGHIRLFKRLSLVHRSWTKLAQRELRRHVCLDFAEGGGTCSASEMILSADFRKGIERLDISTGLGFWRSKDRLKRSTYLELDWYFKRARSAPSPVPPFHSLGPSLRYLCVDHQALEGWELEHFPALEVLLYTNSVTPLRLDCILDTPGSNLRILGIKAKSDLDSGELPRLPPKLKHLALVHMSFQFDLLLSFKRADLRKCRNLRTLTMVILTLSSQTLPLLHEECMAADVTADTSLCADSRAIETFDLEEWALRVED